MAALLVVAIVRAMSPSRALPCEKIHPFYLVPLFMIRATRVERLEKNSSIHFGLVFSVGECRYNPWFMFMRGRPNHSTPIRS